MTIYTIHVVGAGGTGSYFLKEFCRFAQGRKDIECIYIYDGDHVEDKNLSRQCFMAEDIGKNKAAALAEILSEAFDVSCNAVPEYLLDRSQIIETSSVPVLVGCVDNHAARLVMEDYFRLSKSCVLFDSANEFATGEVIFAYHIHNKFIGRERSYYFPEVAKGSKLRTELSCTELNAVAPQHIATNMLAANELLCGVANLLDGIYHPGFTMFNAFRFSTQFIPYREEEETRK